MATQHTQTHNDAAGTVLYYDFLPDCNEDHAKMLEEARLKRNHQRNKVGNNTYNRNIILVENIFHEACDI